MKESTLPSYLLTSTRIPHTACINAYVHAHTQTQCPYICLKKIDIGRDQIYQYLCGISVSFFTILNYYKIKTRIKISDFIAQNRSLTWWETFFKLCIHLFIACGEWEHAHITALMRRSDNNLTALVLSLHICGPESRTRGLSLSHKCLYILNHRNSDDEYW